jgi:thiosulfate/3-mercaptopyruvate sulfurtransferase
MTSPLVSTEWLATHGASDDVYLLDVSVENVVGKEPIRYDTLITLPNSYKVCVDQDLSDTESQGIHVFPKAEQVARVAQRIGFSTTSTLVLYDDQGIYSAPRAWWIFKSFGFEKVFILDGGLPKWIDEHRPTESAHNPPTVTGNSLTLSRETSAVTSVGQLLENIKTGAEQVIDVRSADRFFGRVPEPRPGLRSGHIPGSCNLPFLAVLDGLTYKSASELSELFEEQGFSQEQTFIFSCGSGMTACIVLVAAIIAGYDKVRLYDGSWAEWGADDSLPIEV